MTDIPADIQERADLIAAQHYEWHTGVHEFLAKQIAEAVFAERVRCAKVTPEMIQSGAETITSLYDDILPLTAELMAKDCFRAMMGATHLPQPE